MRFGRVLLGIAIGMLAWCAQGAPQETAGLAANADTKALKQRNELVKSADQAEAKGRYKRAAKLLRRAVFFSGDLQDRANLLVRRADDLYRAGKLTGAQDAYKEALDGYGIYIPLFHVVDRLRELAERFARGDDSLFHVRNASRAADVYELILKKAQAGEKGPTDMLRLAALQTEAHEDEDAVMTYRDLLTRHPRTPEAATGRLELARLLLDMARGGDGDGRLVRQARFELLEFQKESPKHARQDDAALLLTIASNRQADAMRQLGEFYLKPVNTRVPAARRYLHDTIREYPATTSAVVAKAILARIEPGVEPGAGASPAGTGPAAAAKTPEARVIPGPSPAPQAMTPDKVRNPRRFEPLKAGDNVQKWLLPLEDLSQPAAVPGTGSQAGQK